MRKVDFFIVGAPKAGTTSLYHYLDAHPEIEMSSQKEPDFFSDKSLQDQGLYYSKNRINTIKKYHSLFQRGDTLLRGDASVSYLFYHDVPFKISQYNPDSKIIVMLRDPINRAFSHYLMDHRLGLISESFDSIIYKESTHKNAHLFYQQYIEVSEYSRQIKRYLEIFSHKNIYFIDYEDFKNNTSDVLSKIVKFLGLDANTGFHPNLITKHNTYSAARNRMIKSIYSFVYLRKILASILPKNLINIIKNLLFIKNKKPKLSDSTRGFLRRHFESDVIELSKLLNKDFTKWIR